MRTLLWQRLDRPGCEYFSLEQSDGNWWLTGTVLDSSEGVPRLLQYKVVCDAAWCTRSVYISEQIAGERHELKLSGGDLLGHTDVDLGFTPSTNTLPIRRLALPVNGSAEITCAWVRYPGLSVESLPQRYLRLGETRYLYESGTFRAELQVDELGLVRNYEGGWRSIAAT